MKPNIFIDGQLSSSMVKLLVSQSMTILFIIISILNDKIKNKRYDVKNSIKNEKAFVIDVKKELIV